jgi:elongation factor P--(R)-beta-lysine ligase
MTEDERSHLHRLKTNLQRRAQIFDFTRDFFKKQAFLEVETPVRVPVIVPESHITPIESGSWFLSASPELHMKRLLAAGYKRIFQISRCFRSSERGRQHNPEFTMLEWYRTDAGYRQVIQDTQYLIVTLAGRLGYGSRIKYQGQQIDISLPWPKVTVREAFLQAAGWDPVAKPDDIRFDTDLVTKVIPGFAKDRPTVLMDYPAPMASLACLKSDEPGVAERAEIFVGGLELANIFSELTDSEEQEQRFSEAIKQIYQEHGQRRAMPRKLLEALDHIPECGGAALGMDRLIMLLCDAGSIDEVMAFTSDTA